MDPFTALLLHYYKEFWALKNSHEDESNLSFNQNYGLMVQPPKSYPVIESVVDLVYEAEREKGDSVVIIYPSTTVYREVADRVDKLKVDTPVHFFSWQEIYVAMDRSAKDVRAIGSVKERLADAGLVIFLGASQSYPDVIDQVRSFCTGCLIVIG